MKFTAPDKTRYDAGRFGDDCGMNFFSQIIAELRFVDVKIAARENNDIVVCLVLLIYDGFRRFACGDGEQFAKRFNRMRVRRMNKLQFFAVFRHGRFRDACGRLHIGAVSASGAGDDRIFADRCQQHEFM